MDYIRQIEEVNSRRMTALRPPHRKEVLKAREDDIKEKVQNWMSKDNEPRLQRISSELLKEYDSTELVASLLQELVEANDEVEVQLTFEKPLARKNRQSKNGGNHRRSNKKRGGKFETRNKRTKGNYNKKKSNNFDRKDKSSKNRTTKGRTFADMQK